MLTGLPKYAGAAVRRRSSSPKLQVLNTAAFRPTRTLLVGSGGIALDEFLGKPVEYWMGS